MAQILVEIEMGRRGVNIDESDDLKDQNYAEKFILNSETLAQLASLQVAKKVKNGGGVEKITGGVLVLDKTDLPEYEGETFSGAATKLNQVFAYLQIPFFASGWTSKDAQPVTKERTKGENKGTIYTSKPADKIRITRTGEKFDINLYSIEGSTKLEPYVNEETGDTVVPSPSHEATTGMQKRIKKWIATYGGEVADSLQKLGLNVVTK